MNWPDPPVADAVNVSDCPESSIVLLVESNTPDSGAVAAITVKIVKKYNEMKEKSPIRPQAAGSFRKPEAAKKDESLAQKSDRLRSERISNAFKGLS